MKSKNTILILSIIVTSFILSSLETTKGESAVRAEATISKNPEKIIIKDGADLSGDMSTPPLQNVIIDIPAYAGLATEDYFDLTNVDFSGRMIDGLYVRPDWYSEPGCLVNCKFIGSVLNGFHTGRADISTCDFTDASLGEIYDRPRSRPVSYGAMNFDFSGNNDPLSPLYWREVENVYTMGGNSMNHFTTAQFASTRNYTQPFRQQDTDPLIP